MNFGIKNIESKIESLLKQNNFDTKVHFQYSSYNNFDIQCNAFLQIKKIGVLESLKQDIIDDLQNFTEIEDFEITDNGFINIKFSDKHLLSLLKTRNYEVDSKVHILFDYGGPNIGKALHVGHLRTLNIGRSLYKINKFAGNKVTSDVHFGDWGMPVSQIIAYLIYKEIDVNAVNYDDLETIYPSAVKLSKEDEEFGKLCQHISKELNLQNNEYFEKWKIIYKISIDQIKSLFVKLQHSFDLFYGESDVINETNKVVEKAKKDGLVKIDDGALISTEESDPPIIITKADGSYLYMTTDLGTVYFRESQNTYDKYVYVVDSRQSEHFSQLFKTVKHFNLSEKEFNHIGYGTVNGKDGKPLKTREGGVYKLVDLYSDVKNLLKSENLNEEDLNKLTNSVLTFSDLISNRKQNYVFDIEKFVDINGKTAVYLQYSQVRAKKLLDEFTSQNEIFEIDNLNTHERSLVMLISKFSYYFKLSLEKNEPHHLAEYGYNLSSSFNSFYSNNKIFSDDTDPQTRYKRMYIVKEFHKTLINIFYCLGSEPVDKM